MQTIKPNKTQVFAEPDEAETVTKTGIILTQSAQEKPKTAKVINVGDKVTFLKPKDKFAYKPYAATEIKLNNKEYLIIDEEDVLGVVLDVQKI